MIEFRPPELTDRLWAEPLLQEENGLACQYNFANLYLWSRAFCQTAARLEGRILVRVQCREKGCSLYPTGHGPIGPALEALHEAAVRSGAPLTLMGVTAEQRDRLEEAFPGRFEFTPDRDAYDYIYSIDRLADLGGKKLHAKRNHIHRFDQRFPDWMFEPITDGNVRECVALEMAWTADYHHDEPGANTVHEESVAVIEALYQRDALGLEGGLIRAGGEVVAFSLGSFTTPECFDVHFEKAKGEIQGSYAVINREMARMIRRKYPAVKWINREDDLGLEGLRKAKLSYYPDILLEKFIAREVV